MAIATNQQIAHYYDSYSDKEVIFTHEILHTLRIAPREIYIKCGGNQWPCIINSTSFKSAKIILGRAGGAFALITQKNAPPINLRFCFFIDKGTETMSFFIAGKVTDVAQYADSKDLAVVTLTYTQRPPDDFIVKIGALIEADINFIQRKEERIVMTGEARYRLGIEKEDTIVYVQNVPRKCILRDLSFSGAKILLFGLPKFVSGKKTVLRIVFNDPAETLDIRGSIVSADFAEGRQGIVTASIQFDEKAVPAVYKLHINDYLTMTKKNLLDTSPKTQSVPTQTVEQAAAALKARLNAAARRGTSVQNISNAMSGK
ncbi:PilZ domain-containing protein [Treponema socranskii]|uniref:PilZ domain-containing protein n=1 Tax=Treponema socranskii TaxID=53419 RepID=UPI0028E650B1|nr:PilZ domain-containing protein [Treponema socranskii]